MAAQDPARQKVVKEQERPTPVLPEEQRADNEDKAKAELIITALQKRGTEGLWRSLRRDSDPAVRAYLIDRLPSFSVISPQALASRLRTNADPGERAALILALGGYTEQQFNRSQRHKLAPAIIKIYRTDPDPEVHSAADWLLRHKNDHPSPGAFFQEDYPFLHAAEGASQPRPEWDERSALLLADRELAEKPLGDGRWAVNSEGHTMVTILPAAAFQMGAPPNEARRKDGEKVHSIRIPRSFAIANKEVTVAQFQRYLNDSSRRSKWMTALKQRFPRNYETFTAWPQNPQFALTWYDAAAYCNWLSKREGIPPAQWVYPEPVGPGIVMPPDYLHRTGYRLPTEAEWEFAARAGTDSAHFFGDGVELLNRYAWFMANSENHGWTVGSTKPNQFGLFDMYGNAWEWVQDRYVEYLANSSEVRVDAEDSDSVVTNDKKRVRRGGSWSYDKETTRSAHRGAANGYQLDNRMDSVGFRVARTVQSESSDTQVRRPN